MALLEQHLLKIGLLLCLGLNERCVIVLAEAQLFTATVIPRLFIIALDILLLHGRGAIAER